jgi:hypothetical protein
MASLNVSKPLGDDQKWKAEMTTALSAALDRIATLEKQVSQAQRKSN